MMQTPPERQFQRRKLRQVTLILNHISRSYRTHHSSTRRLFRKRLANCHPTGEAERAHFYEQAYNLLDSVSRTPPLIHSNRHQTYLALLYHKATSEKPESLPKAHVDYQNYGYARLPTILLFAFHQRK